MSTLSWTETKLPQETIHSSFSAYLGKQVRIKVITEKETTKE